MSVGTLFTLFVTPMVYTFLARDHAAAVAAGLEAADLFSREDDANGDGAHRPLETSTLEET
jgi:multidrug efflux pump